MITIKNLSYCSPEGEQVSDDASITFADKKTGLIGRNGSDDAAVVAMVASWPVRHRTKGGALRLASSDPHRHHDRERRVTARACDHEGVEGTRGLDRYLVAVEREQRRPIRLSQLQLEFDFDDLTPEEQGVYLKAAQRLLTDAEAAAIDVGDA